MDANSEVRKLTDKEEVRKLTDKELAEVTGGYLPVRDDGTIHSPVTQGWDLKQNKKIG